MFRRKEENSNDPSDTSAPSANAQVENNSPSSAAPSSGSASSTSSSYIPSASAPASSAATAPARPQAPAAATDAARAPAAAPAANYRPAPIAEFNRGAARTPAETLRAASAPSASASSSNASEKSAPVAGKSNRRVLTVGNDILLKGEIATCDRLVIEGRVEAKLSEVHTVEIAECGSFKGTAEVEDAEISGVFEGDLVVRNRLVIYTTGEVRGNISYGEIEIERGGKLTGQIKTAQGAKGKAFEAATAKQTVAA